MSLRNRTGSAIAQSQGNTTLHAHQDLNLAGPTLLLGQAHMRATTGTLNNNGPLQVGQTLVVDNTAHFNNQSTIQSVGGIDVRANRITSNTTGQGGLTSGQNMQLTATNSLHLGGLGQFTAVKDITTSAQTSATQAGQLQAGQAYTHSGAGLSNSGTLNADQVAIQTSLSNTGGVYGVMSECPRHVWR